MKKKNKDQKRNEKKWAKQRSEKGYCQKDVWNIKSWFLELTPKLLQEMLDDLRGCPDEYENIPIHENERLVSLGDNNLPGVEEWKKTIERMIFLLNEMNPEKCSFKNPYQEEFDKAETEFEQKYGFLGKDFERINGIQNENDEYENFYMFYDDPEHPEWILLDYQHALWEEKKWHYRDRCSQEFFSLFSKWFWHLWN